MEIILSVLQILGIILLVLIGLILLILLIVLFVPLRYGIEGHVHDTVWLEAKASWLLHILRAKVSYKDELLAGEIGILWKKIPFSKNFDEDSTKDNATEGKTVEGNTAEGKTEEESKEENIGKTAGEKSSENAGSEEKTSIQKRIVGLIDKIKEKLLFVKKKTSQIKKMIQDEKNRKAISHLKEELFYLIKILLPKKSTLNATFSTGSPDTTGQVFGGICCFPIVYQDKWNLTPDFEAEKAYFEGDFTGKGRIYVFQIIGMFIRIIIDKNCRRLYYLIKRLGGQSNGRGK